MAKQETKKTGTKATPKAEPKKPQAKKAKTDAVKLDHKERFTIEANGTGPRTQKGQILENVGGASAEFYINNGFGKLIK